ncbi:MAG: hypothetical protein AAB316_10175, partial [Bacteroidota bacterium]
MKQTQAPEEQPELVRQPAPYVPQLSAEEIEDRLGQYDGFDELIAPLADDLDRFSPRNAGKKKRFLQDEDMLDKRKELRNRLQAYVNIISRGQNLEMKDAHKGVRRDAQEKLDSNEALINENLSTILSAARDMERTYRDLENFFRNAAPQKVKNLTLLSVHPDVLLDADSNLVYNEVTRRITDESRSVDQKKAYSLLVIPYLWRSKRPKDLIERYTKMAGESRLQFITDFADTDTVDEALNERETRKWLGVTGPEAHHAHLSLFANHILLRGQYQNIQEEGDLRGSPCMAVAGKMYSEKISQPIMGEMNGSLQGSAGLAFHTVQDTVADLSDAGLNSTMHAYEKDMVYEACTAFTGKEYALKRYAVVRTFDYVNRVLRHYLGKVTGQQLDRDRANGVRETIQDFLDQLEVRIDRADLSDAVVDAATVWSEAHGPVIVLNELSVRQQRWARRMILAHELCHLLVDRQAAAELMVASTPWAPPDI